jgi:hypothetical protein
MVNGADPGSKAVFAVGKKRVLMAFTRTEWPRLSEFCDHVMLYLVGEDLEQVRALLDFEWAK